MVRNSYERISWEPILGRYKFSWLKVRPKRRNWGYDWWEDDYYFSMEWLSTYHPSFVDDEVTEYWQSVLEDFSRGSKPVLWHEKAKNFRPAKISAYQQPPFFKTFYWQRVKPFEFEYLKLIDPYVLGLATVYHEMKYTYFIPGFVFRRTRWIFVPGQDPEDVFAYNPCYVFGRAEIDESAVDYLYLDTRPGRIVSMYWPWLTEFFARFFLDFQHVSFVSFWIDIIYRGFSVSMILQRWRYFYGWLVNFTYVEFYTSIAFLWLFVLYKRKVLRYFHFPSALLFLAVMFCVWEYAGSLGVHQRMRDLSHDIDKEILSLNRDQPRDWMLEELYDPSDTLQSHLVEAPEAGILGQDELSFIIRSHYAAPIIFTSWWVSANESLAHFVYWAERDLVGKPRSPFVIFVSRFLKRKFPKIHTELIRRKIPGFRKYTFFVDRFLRRYFGWWLNWRWHGWFWWGRRPLFSMSDRYAQFFSLYDFCMGIEFYIQEYEPQWLAFRDEVYDHIFHDWGVSVQDDEDDRVKWVCYGPPVFGYVD